MDNTDFFFSYLRFFLLIAHRCIKKKYEAKMSIPSLQKRCSQKTKLYGTEFVMGVFLFEKYEKRDYDLQCPSVTFQFIIPIEVQFDVCRI